MVLWRAVPTARPNTILREFRMSYDVSYGYGSAATAEPSERTLFIRRTYSHLAGAILAFIALEAILVNTVPFDVIAGMLGGYNWLLVLGAFMAASWVAQYLGAVADLASAAIPRSRPLRCRRSRHFLTAAHHRGKV